jgi:hypothetical protein
MNAEQVGREFDRLLAAVPDLSGRESTKFHEIRNWLAELLALRRERVNVKYLGTPNNVKNRLTESGGLQPDFTLAITQVEHVPLVFRTAQRLVKPGGVLRTVAVAARGGRGWKVVAVAEAPDTTIGGRLRDLFPEAAVQ